MSVATILCMCCQCDTVTCSPVLCELLGYCACVVIVKLYYVMWMVILVCMCRHCDTVICSPKLCEWLWYCACVVTVIQLCVAQWYAGGYYTVHVSLLWYSYMYPNVMWVVITLCMCHNFDTLICSPMLCEWLLYCTCLVTVIQLYVAQCYVSEYYNMHVSPLW
jgi:hypothetical protein